MTAYNDELSRWITHTFASEDEAARRAREDSPKLGLPAISINSEEGRFLQVLTAAARTHKAVEIGTLGGYSGTWIARGLAPGGRLTTIDINEKHAAVAREHIAAAGLADRVEFRIGPALEVLETLSAGGPFDFVFIDADKESYPAYYEWAVRNLRPGGTITAHNAFRNGRILSDPNDPDVRIMREFVDLVAADDRVLATIYPAGDGTLVAVKRP